MTSGPVIASNVLLHVVAMLPNRFSITSIQLELECAVNLSFVLFRRVRNSISILREKAAQPQHGVSSFYRRLLDFIADAVIAPGLESIGKTWSQPYSLAAPTGYRAS
jgi:hypothetical protein